MTAYRVAEGTQVHHDGVTYGPGETFDATEGAVSQYLAAGWVEPAGKTAETRPVKKTAVSKKTA